MDVRLATLLDAEDGSAVLRRSIAELCGADHRGDPEEIARWTANKTPESWRRWIGNPAARVFVATLTGRVAGVGMVRQDGEVLEVLLNYVSPDTRFHGVSKALLARMEAEAQASGSGWCALVSTRTAERFYKGAGYVEEGRTIEGHLRLRKQVLG